jgi:hypothetical protein
MKKVCLCLLLVLVAMSWNMKSASALPPLNAAWHEKYASLKDQVTSKLGEASNDRCNVCHVPGKGKKEKNDYGKAVGKFITKAKVTEIREKGEASGADADKISAETKKYILEGLQKAEAEKSAAGKSYGELMTAGQLPSPPQ